MAFIDRVVEFPGRVQLTNVSGDVYDMVRAEGDEYTEGTLLNAANLNQQTQLDSAVQTKFAAVETDTSYQNDMSNALNYLIDSFSYISSGNWHYILLGKIFIGVYATTGSLTIGTAVGSIYQTSSNASISYPVTLNNLYYASVDVASSSYSVWTAIYSASTSGIAYRAMSSATRASSTYNIKAIAIGEIA